MELNGMIERSESMSGAGEAGADLNDLLCAKDSGTDRVVVRVSTDYWHDDKGAYFKRSLRVLKRKSSGYNCLLEDCEAVGSADCISKIENIHTVKDGIYEVIVCNISRDWETGYVDDYDLKLVPFGT